MSNQWGQGAGGGIGDLLGAMMGGGSADGLASLVGKLQQGGLQQEVESWVGTGENMPVAPEKLAQAFGGDELAVEMSMMIVVMAVSSAVVAVTKQRW